MKCVDCHHLCAVSGESLPERQREELGAGNPDSFVWLACGHDIAQFTQELPDVFEQVMTEWTCKGYREYDPTSALDEAEPRESRGWPMWQKVAILVLILIALVASVSATVYFAT